MRFGQLKTRDTPRQKRAVARVHLILETTATLLQKGPPQGITTTLIATQARIPVSSIYRYFPKVDDILRELYLQTAAEIREILYATLTDTAGNPGWRLRLQMALDTQREYLGRHPYYRPLLIRFLTQRGPVAAEDEEHDELVKFLHTRWAAGQDGFSGGDAAVVANTVVQMAISMEDLIAAQTDPAAATAYSGELWQLLEGYLSKYLHDE